MISTLLAMLAFIPILLAHNEYGEDEYTDYIDEGLIKHHESRREYFERLLLFTTPAVRVSKDIDESPWESDVRLPRQISPLHYDLFLHPNLRSGMFSGNVKILIQITEPSPYVLLHTKLLNISSILMKNSIGEQVPILKTFEYSKNEFFVIKPKLTILTGNYTISVEFSGSLTNGIEGFYKSVYTNKNGEEIKIAASKFEPTDARKAFPCFDEPSFKSTFSVTIVRPSDGYIALSNMPVRLEEQNQPSTGLTTVLFEKSVPMVTYLACFIVCDFEFEEKFTSIHNTRFRVYANKEQKHRVKYALDIGANITDFFETYFGIPYPLPKQDMIAIPDFSSGAMEHWGLITYRETTLLYDEIESASYNKQRVGTVVSHELAHQWFGNLVTLEWWDDLWLNEGFATFMQYKGVDNYHPDWEMDSQFLLFGLFPVMDLDATLNSHPIIQEVTHPEQISELFDKISYSKGASVLRMLENLMGSKQFRKGVSQFLDKYSFKNAVTDDLWSALAQVSHEKLPIKQIMDTWTRQTGYPVLHVEHLLNGKFRIKQERYIANSRQFKNKLEESYTWDVPLTWITNNSSKTSMKWIGKDQDEMILQIPKSASWVKFNVGQFGYYRVNYPTKSWFSFISLLINDHTIFSPNDRASLLNDAFTLAESGHISYQIPILMSKYLRNETHMVPLRTAFSKLTTIGKYLQNTKAQVLFQRYIEEILEKLYSRLGWADEGSHVQKLTRNSVLQMACRNEHIDCNQVAGKLFTKWIQNDMFYIPPNQRSVVYEYGMAARGNETSWKIMFNRFSLEKKADEKLKLIKGLAKIKDKTVLKTFIELSKNETIIRSQDFRSTISAISSTTEGSDIAWNFIQREWTFLENRFFLKKSALDGLVKSVVSSFATKTELIEVEQFFAENPEEGPMSRTRQQIIEHIQHNIRWLEDYQRPVHSFLEEK